jgi:hypothetical protein
MKTASVKAFRLFIAVSASILISSTGHAGQYDKLFSVSDVEKGSGLTGLKTVANGQLKAAGGDLNFATEKNKMVLMVQVFNSDWYERYKGQKGYFKAEVKGVGDAAFKGLAADPQLSLFIKKGNSCVVLTTFYNLLGKPPTMMTMDQLIDLGKLITGRI